MNVNKVGASAESDISSMNSSVPEWFRNALSAPRAEGWTYSGGTRIHYFEWGDPSNPGILLTHGFMAHSRCWAFIAPLLADRYHLVAFDLSGMGDSGWRDSYSVDGRVLEAESVADAVGMTRDNRKPFLVCHSYGGSVGLAAVEKSPDRWAGLIVCDMTMVAPGQPLEFESQRKKRQERGVREHKVSVDLETAKKRFRLAPEQPCENRFLMEYMALHSLKRIDAGWIWKFDPKIMGPDQERDANWWQSLSDRFAALQASKAVIYGEHSTMFGSTVAEYLNRNTKKFIPMVPIKAAYHHIMLDQPIGFSAAIDSLLQGFRE